MNMSKNNVQKENETRNNYTVYMHESPSGKRYVGITKTSLKKRWGSGHGYKNNPYFWRAIQKYGWKNIKHKIIAEGLSKEDACKMEIDLISKLNLTDAEFGYNIRQGGDLPTEHLCKRVYMYDSNTGCFIQEFSSIADAESYFGKPDANTIGKICKDNCYRTCFGYLWRDKQYEKIDVSERQYWILIFDRFTLEKIGCYYKSSQIFTEYNGEKIIPGKVVRVCNNKSYTYRNIICCYLKDYMDMLCNFNDKDFTAVYQIDDNKNVVGVYKSYKEASKTTGIKHVNTACKHKYQQSGGYIWESIGYDENEDIYEKSKQLEQTYNFGIDVTDDEADSICAGIGYIKMFT